MKKDERRVSVLLLGCDKEVTELTEKCLKIQKGKPLDITKSFLNLETEEIIRACNPQVIVCDLWHCSKSDLELLMSIKESNSRIPIILFTLEEDLCKDKANFPIEVIQKYGDAAFVYAHLKERIEALANISL